MSVSVHDNTPQVRADINRKIPLALRFMLDAIDKLSTPKTPKNLGDLRNNKLKQVLGLHAVIQWRQRYAAIQEDKQHKNYTTAGTGPHYAQNAVKAVVADAGTYFRRAGL
jgi:hypothetical protein